MAWDDVPRWAVPPDLQPYVASWTPYFEVMDVRAVHHGIPSPQATVIIAFDEPLDVGWLADPSRHDQLWVSAAGLHVAPALIRTHGLQHGIQIALTPAGVRALLGLPLGALVAEIVTHDALPLGIDQRVHDRLAAAPDWATRRAVLHEHLRAVLDRVGADAPQPAPEVGEAWALIGRRAGDIRVDHVADHVGWSRRHLAARFHAEYGVSPKQAARLFRFDRARTLAACGTGLAEVAATCGFADQAHLTREWRDLAGHPPAQSLAEPFSILQDDPGP